MTIAPTALPDVVLISPRVFEDDRGAFFEGFNESAFTKALGVRANFVQDNHSTSLKNVVRGLHYQRRHAQGKLVRVVAGEIFDVAVDVRRSSPTFGKWVGAVMSAENRLQMWIPVGFAHGFLALSDRAEVLYKATDFYAPQDELTIMWNDPALAIEWPLTGEVRLSPKDKGGVPFHAAEVFD